MKPASAQSPNTHAAALPPNALPHGAETCHQGAVIWSRCPLVARDLRVCDVDMSTSQLSVAQSVFAESACDAFAEDGVLGLETFDLGSCGVESLAGRGV